MARIKSWTLRSFWTSWSQRFHSRRGRRPASAHPRFEPLEDRTVPASFSPLPGTLDGTSGSLRAVINLANTNGDSSNTFNLSAGTYNLVALGDLQLTAAKTYTFVGKAPGSTFINANQFERVFNITTAATVVFQKLTIQNGLATDSGGLGAPFDTDILGGGILNNGGAVTLNNAVVKNCLASGPNGDDGTQANSNGGNGVTGAGGGIFSLGGSLTLLNGAALTGNRANGGNGGKGANSVNFSDAGSGGNGGDAFGGGLAASGTVVSITGGALSSNVARAGNGGNGGNGGSDGNGGNSGNGGNAQGGGLYISGGSLSITGNNDPGNQAIGGNAGNAGNGAGSGRHGGNGGNGGNAQGGGLYVTDVGTVGLTLLSINPGNAALGGNGGQGGHGGSGSDSGGTGGDGGNGGNGQGGGIYTTSSTLNLTTSTVNASRSAGGNGARGGDAGNPSDTRNNTDTGWHGGNAGNGGLGQGGGLFVASGKVTVFRSTVSANTSTGGNAGKGGTGAHINDGNSDLLAGAGGAGGAGGNAQGAGLYAAAGLLTVSDSTVAANVVGAANTGLGGAGGTGGRGTNHNAADGNDNDVNGGAGGTGGNGGNGGTSQGGALYNATATVQLRNSTIASNRANAGGAAGAGGAGGAGGTGATGKIGGAGGTGGTGGNLNTNGTTGKAGHAHSGTTGGAGGAGGTGGAGAGGQGGGVDNAAETTISVVSTIIAKDVLAAGFGTTAKGPDILGAFATLGHNLIGNSANGSGFAFLLNGDLVGGSGHPLIDPLLGPLAFNGGPTQTLALLRGSPAIDGGSNPDNLTVDQRGFGRVDHLPALPPETAPDIGAYETPILPPLPPPTPRLVFPSKRFFLASNF